MYFHRDGGWWYLRIGRLEITYKPSPFDRWHFSGGEAPGVWTYSYGPFQFLWWRKWTVWKDHPNRAENMRFYNQFGTW